MNNSRRELIRSLKFLFFSASAGIIQLLAFAMFETVLKLPHWLSYLCALCLSVLWNFTLNRKFTFRSAGNIPQAMTLVALFYLVFTPLSTWWTAVLTGPEFMWNEYLVLAITMLINFSTEYLYQRFVVFRKSLDTAK